MKCYELQGPSGIDGLTLVDKPVTQPGEGQVLVRLKAATLNYRDLLMIKGGYGSRQKFPLVPLSDGAGVIEAVGSCVREFVVGDRVVGSFFESWLDGAPSDAKMRAALGGAVDGVLAEYRLFPAQALVKTPEHLSDIEAAALPCAGLTAWSAVVKLGDVEAGSDGADARNGRGLAFCASIRKDVRRPHHRNLVQRRKDRAPQTARRGFYAQLHKYARLGKEGAGIVRARCRSCGRSWRCRDPQRINPSNQDRGHDRIYRRACGTGAF